MGVLEVRFWGVYLDPLRAERQALPTEKGVAWPPLRTMNESINLTSLRYTQCSTLAEGDIIMVEISPEYTD